MPAVEPVQGQAILDPMRPALARLDALHRDLDPVATGKLEFEAVEAKQRLKIVVNSDHNTSYQDLMFKSKSALCSTGRRRVNHRGALRPRRLGRHRGSGPIGQTRSRGSGHAFTQGVLRTRRARSIGPGRDTASTPRCGGHESQTSPPLPTCSELRPDGFLMRRNRPFRPPLWLPIRARNPPLALFGEQSSVSAGNVRGVLDAVGGIRWVAPR